MKRLQHVRAHGEVVTKRARIAWWVSTISLVALLLNVRFGTLSIAGFVGIWALHVLAWPRHAADMLLRTWLPWIFPLVALASALWSMEPDLTIRLGVEWLMTVGIAIMMARSLPEERFIAAWASALVPVVIIGGVIGGTQYTETQEIAATGIFGSKNNFALHICLMLFASFAALGDPSQRKVVRILALVGVGAGPLLLWRAKSVGALAVFFPSLLLMCSIIALGRLTIRLRRIALLGSLMIMIVGAAVITPVLISSQGALLNTVGKSSDLTGRGYLWYRAGFLVEQRPILGVGYSAFWVQGNPEAEGLWRSEHIEARGGFHFHNAYYQTLVELGYVGLFFGVVAFVATAVAVVSWAMVAPGPGSGFFCALVFFLFVRSFVELDLGGGFGLNTLILPAAWVYATSALRHAGSPIAQRRLSNPLPMAADLRRHGAA